MLQTAVLLLALGTARQGTPSPLKIVVIEGEAGVNIIQQKTAVKPIVEVRDRNDQPVAGVIVTFSIEGGKAATFGGASTLTVATNAAGQAAVGSLTPNVAGAFQIHVAAAFQGQVATATIAQTNVLTAAQAAAASAATGTTGSAGSAGGGGGAGAGGAGGAAGGAGGGLSVTTIAVAGAAVAGGAVAATQLADKAGGGATQFSGTFSGTITGVISSRAETCNFTYTISGAEAHLKFKDLSDTSANGMFEYSGPSSLTASTCVIGPAPLIPQFIGSTELTGTSGGFSGRRTISSPSAGITGDNNYIFQGSASGNTASGTFTYEQNSVNGAEGITVKASGTFPITFQKQ